MHRRLPGDTIVRHASSGRAQAARCSLPSSKESSQRTMLIHSEATPAQRGFRRFSGSRVLYYTPSADLSGRPRTLFTLDFWHFDGVGQQFMRFLLDQITFLGSSALCPEYNG